MAIGPEERERQLDDLRKEIGGRLNPDDEHTKARMKDHYQHQFTKAIDDAKAAHQRGDSSNAMWHERLASDVHDIIKLLE
jgi:thiamine biosynthesis protein ThiC